MLTCLNVSSLAHHCPRENGSIAISGDMGGFVLQDEHVFLGYSLAKVSGAFSA